MIINSELKRTEETINLSVRIVGLLTKTETGDLPNNKQKTSH